MKFQIIIPQIDLDAKNLSASIKEQNLTEKYFSANVSSTGIIYSSHLKEKEKGFINDISRFLGHSTCVYEGNNEHEAKKIIRKFYKDTSISHLIIIGDELTFPSFRYRTRNSVSYSDVFYEDIESNGQFNLNVGRIFASPKMILKHLTSGDVRSGNSAVLFDSNPEQHNMILDELHSLGLTFESYKQYNQDLREKIINSNLVLQLSDGYFDNVIHGSSTELVTDYGNLVFSYKDFKNLNFKNYPLFMNQACTTGNFGPLVHSILNSGGCFLGASSSTIDSYNRLKEWESVFDIFGYTLGFFKKMNDVNTLGEAKTSVQRSFFGNLELSLQEQYFQFLSGNTRIIDDLHLRIILQMQFFGNPTSATLAHIKERL